VPRPTKGIYEDAPHIIALVELVEGVRMMSNIVGDDAIARVRLDAPVQVEFEIRDGMSVPVFTLAAA
jgi:uncharacterized OB-fold protein